MTAHNLSRLIAIVVATAGIAARAASAQSLPTATAPDLRLEWVVASVNGVNKEPPVELAPIEGRAGETIRLKYRIRNVGSTDAFAVVVRIQTGLGNGGRPTRIQPGPAAGKAIERTLDLPLAVGLAEVCVGAVLQTLRLDDPRDPFTEDNRICRRATVRPAAQSRTP